MFTGKRKWALYGLGLLLLAAFAGFLVTRSAEPSPFSKRKGAATAPPKKLVDEGPLQTANSLALLASTAEEQQIAQQAVRVADHEVDLAFASKLRQAQDNPAPLTGDLKALADRVHRLESRLKSVQQESDRLTKAASSGNNDASGQLDIVQARVTLLQDVLDDAKQDLAERGGDPQAEIKKELDEHEAVQHDQKPLATSKGASFIIGGSLLSQFRAWQQLRESRARLLGAQQDALSAAKTLAHTRDSLQSGIPESLASRERHLGQ